MRIRPVAPLSGAHLLPVPGNIAAHERLPEILGHGERMVRARDGETFGPFTPEQMSTGVQEGQLRREDLIWRAGMSVLLASDVPGHFRPPALVAPFHIREPRMSIGPRKRSSKVDLASALSVSARRAHRPTSPHVLPRARRPASPLQRLPGAVSAGRPIPSQNDETPPRG